MSTSTDHKIDAVIVAAGSGKRLGYPVPKAFVPLGGKPMIEYSLNTLLSHKEIGTVVLVVPAEKLQTSQKEYSCERVKVVAGGEQRWNSVNNGVKSTSSEWIFIHDAARPFVTDPVIDRILEKKNSYDCIITVTPEVDTVRNFEGDRAGNTVDRDKLVRVGTPQLFRRKLLLEALDLAGSSETPPTDEAVLMQNMGVAVGIAWGDPGNFKITTQSDLKIAEAIIAAEDTMRLGR
ncbi:MAG: 2-C-methyl-D-erythritol 4-phosphate cytidylyltransferase [Fibrobacter sp.]|nr:2-C-methyl-D-erythritol 4-phosphate cytidylyltransferase [Fibrobacter sp.]